MYENNQFFQNKCSLMSLIVLFSPYTYVEKLKVLEFAFHLHVL